MIAFIIPSSSIAVYNRQHNNQLTALTATAELSEHNALIYVHGEFIHTCIISLSQGPLNEAAWLTPFTCLHIKYSNVCVQTGYKLLLYFSYYFLFHPFFFFEKWGFRKYILLEVFSRISSYSFLSSLLSSSLCHLVSAPLLFVPWFHCSVLQFQHFNISSNISRAESRVAELFSTPEIWVKKVWHTHAHIHTPMLINTHTHCRFMALGVDFFQWKV